MYKIGDRVYSYKRDQRGTILDIITVEDTPLYRHYKIALDDGSACWTYQYDIAAIATPFEDTREKSMYIHLTNTTEEGQEPKLTTEQYIDKISETLKARGKNYGDFREQANISQELAYVMRAAPKWDELDCDMAEALEMIQHKIARILNGNPYYHDSWHDISGYAKLVADRLDK